MIRALLDTDRAFFALLNGQDWPGWLDAFFVFITDDEDLVLRLIVLGLFVLLLIRRSTRRRALWLLPLLALSDFLNSSVLKEIFQRARPCHGQLEGLRLLVDCGPGFSFPSSHAANMGAAGIFLFRGMRSEAGRAPVLILTLLVAYSRVHVGVHWPLDVAAGYLLGGLLALALEAGLGRLPSRLGGLPSGSGA